MRLSPNDRVSPSRAPRDATVLFAALLVGIAGFLAGCPDKKPKKPEVPAGACQTDADCPDGGVCKDGVCTPCASDGECGDGKTCKEGRCLGPGACSKDEDCADDEDCVNNICTKAGAGGADVGCTIDPVYFGFDGTTIDDKAKATLNAGAECIKSVADRTLMLVGHTDPRGTEEYNIALSEKRAQSVGDYLARLGIDPARFHVVPKGESAATGTDESGWGQDRRVELEWQ
jgi:peptidoglycan-associated lipoprotein